MSNCTLLLAVAYAFFFSGSPSGSFFSTTPSSGASFAADSGSGNNSGIYLSPADFRHHTLSYECSGPSDKIRLNNFLASASPGILVIHQGQRTSLPKEKIFGYHDSRNRDFRFYNNTSYQIIDTAGFYLYSHEMLVQGSKIARPATIWYFSADAASPVLPLTQANLQQAFASHPALRYHLQSQFRSDNDLTAYDPYLKTYKIKYIYGQYAN